jgi:hypothetical protein
MRFFLSILMLLALAACGREVLVITGQGSFGERFNTAFLVYEGAPAEAPTSAGLFFEQAMTGEFIQPDHFFDGPGLSVFYSILEMRQVGADEMIVADRGFFNFGSADDEQGLVLLRADFRFEKTQGGQLGEFSVVKQVSAAMDEMEIKEALEEASQEAVEYAMSRYKLVY